MQCYEFEVLVEYLLRKVTEFGLAGQFERHELADVLSEHAVVTIDRLPDVVSLARNLQQEIRQAA